MPITYMPAEGLIHISAADVSYIIHIYRGCYPLHVYYGKRVPEEDVRWYVEAPYRRKKLIENLQPDDPMFLREFFPFEYPTYGTSDFRKPALDLRDAAGSCVTDLRYTGHEIIPGKPALKGMPSLYCETDGEATTLRLDMQDAKSGLKVALYYTVFEKTGLITRRAEIANGGDTPVTLKSALSVSMDFKHAPYEMLQLSGTALREHHIVRRKLECGETSIDSTRGISSHQQNPFIALVQQDTTETQGDAYGLSLVYSGNFVARVECDMYMSARVQLGINPFMFSWLLNPGDTFETPEAVMSYSPNGLNGMSQKLHDAFRTRLYRGVWRDRERPVLLNTWEAAYFDFTHDKIMEMARKAAKVGVELLVLDDGWFGHRDNDRSSLGDWYVAQHKLPHGLDGLARDINALGMKFGLWFEPEMISPDSDLYRAHPDWCLHTEGRERSIGRNQYVLDMSRKDVRDNIFDQMYKILSSANIEYVKWDFNRNLTEVGSELLPPDRQSEVTHRYMLGVYELLERLLTAFPHLLLEGCSGGGGRFDAGMLYYSPQIWTSDDTDAIERLEIQYGTSLVYPPSSMSAHVSACPNHQTRRSTPFKTRGDVALAGAFGYELDLTKLNDEERELVRRQVAAYHEYYDVIQNGDYYRLIDPAKSKGDMTSAAAWESVSTDKREVLLTYVVIRTQPSVSRYIRLRGLDPDVTYTDTESGRSYSGALLMNAGLNLTGSWRDGESRVWHFVAE